MKLFNYLKEFFSRKISIPEVHITQTDEKFLLDSELRQTGNKLVADSPFILSWPIRTGSYISFFCTALSASVIHAFYRKRFRIKYHILVISYFAVCHTAIYASLSNTFLVTDKLKSFIPFCVPCTMIKLGSIQVICSVILPILISSFANIHYSEVFSTFAMPPGLFRSKHSTIEGFKIWLNLTKSNKGPMIFFILSLINFLCGVALVQAQIVSHKAILKDWDQNFGYKM